MFAHPPLFLHFLLDAERLRMYSHVERGNNNKFMTQGYAEDSLRFCAFHFEIDKHISNNAGINYFYKTEKEKQI